VPIERSWDAAESHCNDLGGHLASIHSRQEHDFITSLTNDLTQYVWIGANTEKFGLNWAWTDGSYFKYSNWGSGQPNQSGGAQHCMDLLASSGRKWNDNQCHKKVDSVCKI